jgi:hypothetical protein
MESELLASRLAARLRIPIAILGSTSALLATANLITPWVPDLVVTYAAIAVACAAAVIFFCATFDPRFQKAISALNAERRAQAHQLGAIARLLGLGLPAGDRVLFALSLILLTVTLGASNPLPAAALGFSAFLLVGMSQIALMVRGYPTDRYVPPFT